MTSWMQGKTRGYLGVALAWAACLGACKKQDEAPPRADEAPVPAEDAQAALPSAESLLEKAVQAAGGREALERVHSFHQTSRISIEGQNISGEVEVWWKDGDFYTEQRLVGIGEIRGGKQGDVTWAQDPINGLRKLSGVEAEQLGWASALILEADWQRFFVRAETRGEREVDGHTVDDVVLTTQSGESLTLSFDRATGLQFEQAFEQISPMGKMPIRIRMDDYREIEGITIPFKQVSDVSLAKALQQIQIFDLNAKVDTTRFAMPTGDAEVVGEGDLQPLAVPPAGKAR